MSKEVTTTDDWQLSPVLNEINLKTLFSSTAIRKSLVDIAVKTVTPDRIVKMFLLATSRQPDILKCTQASIIRAAMTAAETGLDFTGTFGRAYLVPLMNNKLNPPRMEVNFWPGYLGLMDLARNSDEIKSMDADVVYADDEFVYEKGLEEKFVHKPNWSSKRLDDDVIAAYFIARFKSGGHHIEVVTRIEIDKVRFFSKMGQRGAWRDWFPAMAKKTAVRRGLKYCPLSLETQAKLSLLDDDLIDITPANVQEEGTLRPEDLKPGNPQDHQEVDAPSATKPLSEADKIEIEFDTICQGKLPLDIAEYFDRLSVAKTLILEHFGVSSAADLTSAQLKSLPKYLESKEFTDLCAAEGLLK